MCIELRRMFFEVLMLVQDYISENFDIEGLVLQCISVFFKAILVSQACVIVDGANC